MRWPVLFDKLCIGSSQFTSQCVSFLLLGTEYAELAAFITSLGISGYGVIVSHTEPVDSRQVTLTRDCRTDRYGAARGSPSIINSPSCAESRWSMTSCLLVPATNTRGYIKDMPLLIDPWPGQVLNARNQFGPDSANECKEARSRRLVTQCFS